VNDEQVIRLTGDIDLVVKDELMARFDAAVAAAATDGHVVRVDLGEVTFMDSTGFSCIANALRALEPVGGTIVLLRTPPFVRRVLELTGLDHLCEDAPER
jgi:anti-sigma B factor antagonist